MTNINGADYQAGEVWKDPDEDSHWIEPDICWTADSFSLGVNSVAGGFHNPNDRINKNFHCFRCVDGQKVLPSMGSSMDDRLEVCNSMCLPSLGGVEPDNAYFIHEGIFYKKSYYLDTWDGIDV